MQDEAEHEEEACSDGQEVLHGQLPVVVNCTFNRLVQSRQLADVRDHRCASTREDDGFEDANITCRCNVKREGRKGTGAEELKLLAKESRCTFLTISFLSLEREESSDQVKDDIEGAAA